jgi:hypothetical protein
MNEVSISERVYGLTDDAAKMFRDAADAVGCTPKLLCTIGMAHYNQQNHGVAHKIWREVMQEVTHPAAQLDAAAHTLYAARQSFAPPDNLKQAVDIVHERAQAGNPNAMIIASQIARFVP